MSSSFNEMLMVTVKANATQAVNTFKQLESSINSITGPVNNISAAISASQAKLGGWKNPADEVNAKFGQMSGRIKTVDQAVGQTTKSMAALNKRASTFDMRLLSLLFGGMALKRLFGGILRSIGQTFLKAEDNTSGLAMATVRLNASWEFLKFSIMDALNTDFFIGMIDGIVNFINWLSQLDSAWKITFLFISGGLFILGTIIMTIGQSKLFWDAVLGQGGFLKTMNIITAKTLGPNGIFTKIKNFAVAGIVIKAIFDLDSYLKGDISLRSLIDKLGQDLALIGLVSGKPWMIAVGISLNLLKFGTQIKDFGAKLLDQAMIDAESAKKTTGLSAATSSFKAITKGALSIPLIAAGGTGEFIDNWIGSVDNAESSVTTLSSKTTDFIDLVNNPFGQSLDKSIEKISGEKESLVSSFKDTSIEMDIFSNNKAPNLIVANNSMIESNNSLIESNNAVAASFSGNLRNLKDQVNTYIESSPVSDEGE